MKIAKMGALLIAAALLLTACAAPAATGTTASTASTAATESTASASASENNMGAFTTVDLDGNTVTEAVFADADLTLVNLWATYCGYCLKEMPDLGALAEEYKDQGFQIIGLVMDVGSDETQLATAKSLVEQTGASYTHLLPVQEMSATFLQFGSATPTSFFVDKDGNVVGDSILGMRGADFWRTEIEAKLAEVKK